MWKTTQKNRPSLSFEWRCDNQMVSDWVGDLQSPGFCLSRKKAHHRPYQLPALELGSTEWDGNSPFCSMDCEGWSRERYLL
jgi:hypothetical protein